DSQHDRVAGEQRSDAGDHDLRDKGNRDDAQNDADVLLELLPPVRDRISGRRAAGRRRGSKPAGRRGRGDGRRHVGHGNTSGWVAGTLTVRVAASADRCYSGDWYGRSRGLAASRIGTITRRLK